MSYLRCNLIINPMIIPFFFFFKYEIELHIVIHIDIYIYIYFNVFLAMCNQPIIYLQHEDVPIIFYFFLKFYNNISLVRVAFLMNGKRYLLVIEIKGINLHL